MGHQRPVAAESQKPGQLYLDGVGVPDHVLPDAGELGDAGGDGLCGLHIAVELVPHFPTSHDAGGDFDDLAVCGRQTGGFGVEHHHLIVQQDVAFALDGVALLQIVDAVGLDAVKHLDIGAALFQLGGGVHGFREGLHHAVIGDGQRLVAHGGRQFEGLARVAQGIHAGHIGVQVQFHPLVRSFVGAAFLFALDDGRKVQHKILVEHGIVDQALHDDVSALFDLALQFGRLFVGQHLGGTDGAGAVGKLKHDHGFLPAIELFELHKEDFALHGDLAAVHVHVAQFDHFPGEGLAVDDIVLLFGAEHGGVGVFFLSKIPSLGLVLLGRRGLSGGFCRAAGLILPGHLGHSGLTGGLGVGTVTGGSYQFQTDGMLQQSGSIFFQIIPQLLQTGGVPWGSHLHGQAVFRQQKGGLPQAGGGRRIFFGKILPQSVGLVKRLAFGYGNGLLGGFGCRLGHLLGSVQLQPDAGHAVSTADGNPGLFQLAGGHGNGALQLNGKTVFSGGHAGDGALPHGAAAGCIGEQITKACAHRVSPVMASISAISFGKSSASGTL